MTGVPVPHRLGSLPQPLAIPERRAIFSLAAKPRDLLGRAPTGVTDCLPVSLGLSQVFVRRTDLSFALHGVNTYHTANRGVAQFKKAWYDTFAAFKQLLPLSFHHLFFCSHELAVVIPLMTFHTGQPLFLYLRLRMATEEY